MQISQYVGLFLSEAQDHIQEMNQALLALEREPEDLTHLEAFFRAAHTMKGMAATMGFQQMASLAHHMEDLLDILRKRERRLTPALADLLFRGLDTLSELLRGIEAGEGEKIDVGSILSQLQTQLEAPQAGEATAAATTAPPQAGWEVEVSISPDCVLKGPRAFLVWRQLTAVGAILGSDPPEEALRAGEYEADFRIYLDGEADPTTLQEAATSVAEIANAVVRRIEGQEEPAPTPPAAEVEKEEAPRAERGPSPIAPVTPLVRIKVTLLDRLLEAVAELVINRSHLIQVARKHELVDLEEALESHQRGLDLLQEAVLTMRMTPVFQVFNRFPRMVRDLAHQQQKEVRFEIEGAEIELDRTILEKITDPLVHLLRNAIDHGIEPPEERRAAGKTTPARLQLLARRERDKAVIEVQDDGRGMSAQRIADLAVERGVVSEQEVAEMDRAAIFELICRPGFSTRTEVTGVSGRGVGMEVVKATMDEIGGTLEIDSQVGQGTSFRLIFPLTMAILPALLVQARGTIYALLLTHVVRTIEPQAEELDRLHGEPVLRWNGQVLPLYPLPRLLQPNGEGGELEIGDLLSVIVVQRGRHRYGLVVDEILGKEDIVLKPLEGVLQQIEGLAGATIRGEGEIVFVLDIPTLIRSLGKLGSNYTEPGAG